MPHMILFSGNWIGKMYQVLPKKNQFNKIIAELGRDLCSGINHAVLWKWSGKLEII